MTPVTPARASARPSIRRRLAMLLASVITSALVLGAAPTPAAASTATDMAASILGWMNQDRVAQGLVGYRGWASLDALAAQRAGRMAEAHTLSHEVAGGDVGLALDAMSVPWYRWGEIIGMSGFPYGTEAASNVYSLWKASSPHRAIMFSSDYNYVGIGIAQATDGTSWFSIVMTESPDHTAPIGSTRSLTRSGTTIRYKWQGVDRKLQTHTAGIKSYDIAYRVDSGAWKIIRNDTTYTGITLTGRSHRHYYSFRVQAKDRRGNLSRWSGAIRIWVP
jgi:uncharacterized protein YkwD